MSFVTSYLGMNTNDIRNMSNSQSTFWAIALPVTIVVVGLAVLAAYKGDSILEWLFHSRQRLKITRYGQIEGRRRRGSPVAQHQRETGSFSNSTQFHAESGGQRYRRATVEDVEDTV